MPMLWAAIPAVMSIAVCRWHLIQWQQQPLRNWSGSLRQREKMNQCRKFVSPAGFHLPLVGRSRAMKSASGGGSTLYRVMRPQAGTTPTRTSLCDVRPPHKGEVGKYQFISHSPSFLCLSQESMPLNRQQATTIGGAANLEEWIPVTNTGMTDSSDIRPPKHPSTHSSNTDPEYT